MCLFTFFLQVMIPVLPAYWRGKSRLLPDWIELFNTRLSRLLQPLQCSRVNVPISSNNCLRICFNTPQIFSFYINLPPIYYVFVFNYWVVFFPFVYLALLTLGRTKFQIFQWRVQLFYRLNTITEIIESFEKVIEL